LTPSEARGRFPASVRLVPVPGCARVDAERDRQLHRRPAPSPARRAAKAALQLRPAGSQWRGFGAEKLPCRCRRFVFASPPTAIA
jgi:hypothetical protein